MFGICLSVLQGSVSYMALPLGDQGNDSMALLVHSTSWLQFQIPKPAGNLAPNGLRLSLGTKPYYSIRQVPLHIRLLWDATQSPRKSATFSSLKIAIPPSLPLLSLVSIFPADRCPVLTVAIFSFDFPKLRVNPPPSPYL